MVQPINLWKTAALFVVLTSMAWGPPLYAGRDENPAVLTMLHTAYGPYNPQVKGWVVAHEGIRYTFRILDQRKIATPQGDRLYVLTGSDAPEEKASHATAGLLGAFIGVDKGRSVHIIASAKALPFGRWGKAPETFTFHQFGPDAYFGWIIASGYTAQGHTSLSQTILLPYGQKVSERGSFTTCDEDFSIAVDTKAVGVNVFPLIVTIKHEGRARKGRAETLKIPFDEKTLRYRSPQVFSGGC